MKNKLLSTLPVKEKKTEVGVFWGILTKRLPGIEGGFLFLICYIALLGIASIFALSIAQFVDFFAQIIFYLLLVLFPLVSLVFIGRWTGIGILLYLNKITGKIPGTISKRKLSIIGWFTGAGYLLLLLSGRLIWQLLYHAPIFSWWILHEAQVIVVIFGISLFSAIAAFRSLSPENKAFLAEKLGNIE